MIWHESHRRYRKAPMDLAFLSIVGLSVVLGTAAMIFLPKESRSTESPFDVEKLRQEMIAQAETEEERKFLTEMDQLDLHRRHLIC